jgi:hypothetical protein
MCHIEDGYRNCVRGLRSATGKIFQVHFDAIGIPSIEGRTLLCARPIKDVYVGGIDAWEAESRALAALGMVVIKMANAIIIFR